MIRNKIRTLNGIEIFKIYTNAPKNDHVYHAVKGPKSWVFQTLTETEQFAEAA